VLWVLGGGEKGGEEGEADEEERAEHHKMAEEMLLSPESKALASRQRPMAGCDDNDECW